MLFPASISIQIRKGGDNFDFVFDESVSEVLVLILLSLSSSLLFLDDDGSLSFIVETDKDRKERYLAYLPSCSIFRGLPRLRFSEDSVFD